MGINSERGLHFMIIGLPKEVKDNENRVALDPVSAGVLANAGHELLVEAGAGEGSTFPDQDYEALGAEIVESAAEVWERAEMIVKVKEPQPSEFEYFREGLILFTYLHLSNEEEVTKALVDEGVTAVAYETIERADGSLPLLEPMSEVAGAMAGQIGGHYLQKTEGGKGIVPGGVPGTEAGVASIIGGGNVGTHAAEILLGLGMDVRVLELDARRRRELENQFGHARLKTIASNSGTVHNAVKESDILVGAVLIPGRKAPKLVTQEMLKDFEPGGVIVDPAIDQGGNFEGYDEPTTHSDPVIRENGIVYYGVANMPGAVPNTASQTLAVNTVNYALNIANRGVEEYAKADPLFALGINTYKGKVTYKPVAEDLGYDYVDPVSLM